MVLHGTYASTESRKSFYLHTESQPVPAHYFILLAQLLSISLCWISKSRKNKKKKMEWEMKSINGSLLIFRLSCFSFLSLSLSFSLDFQTWIIQLLWSETAFTAFIDEYYITPSDNLQFCCELTQWQKKKEIKIKKDWVQPIHFLMELVPKSNNQRKWTRGKERDNTGEGASNTWF